MKNQPTQGVTADITNTLELLSAPASNSIFFALSPDPMCVLTQEGHLLNVNPAFMNTLGYTDAEVTGNHIRNLVHPEDVETIRRQANVLLENKAPIRHKNRVRKKNGIYGWFEWYATISGEQNTIFAIGKDCTELQNHQHLLDDALIDRTTILESITDGFFIMDSSWKVTYWNRQAAVLLGIAKSEIIDRCIWEVFPEEIGKTFYTHYHQAVADQQTTTFEGYLARTEQCLEVTVYPSPGSLIVYFKDVTRRKEREAALSEMNQQLKAITKASFGAIWEFDLASQTYFLHDENFKELFGYDLVNEKVDAQQWIEFLHQEDRERVMSEAMQVIHLGIEFSTLSYRVYKSNGDIAYVLARAYLIKNGNGVAKKLVGCIEDVTAQYLSEAALTASEEKYKLLFHNAPLPQWICDIETYEILDVNIAAIAHYGYTREEFLNLTIRELRPKEEAKNVIATIEKGKGHQQSTHWGTAIHLKKDGTRITVEIQTTQVPYNGRTTWLCTVNDITVQEMAKRETQQSKQDYKTLFSSAPLPQVIYSLETLMFLKVNDAAIEHYGYTREEFLSMSIFELRPKEEIEKLRAYVNQLRIKGQKFVGTWTHLKKNGERITVETTATKINYEGKECVLVGFHDLTKNLKLEEKLINLRVAAQEKITKAQIKAQEQQRELIGRELHDNINQLLTTSKLYLDLARTNEEMRVDLIAKSEGVLLLAIQEIRDLSKSLASPVLQDEGFFAALDELIEGYRVAQPFAFHANYQQCTAVDALAEEAQLTLYRILQEQLTNIIKYAAAKNVWIDFESLNGHIYLVIKDDGKGFDTSRKRHGVGLKNIKHRLALFNGSMSIDSSPGNGCSLHVLLPIEDNCTDLNDQRSLEIFIAEDDEEDQAMLQLAFEKANPDHRLTFAKNGNDLLESLDKLEEENLPQVIVLDYSMPGKNGLLTLQALQVNQRYRTIPKIVYSTSSYDHHKMQCLTANATAYIEKGLTMEEIEDNVKQILSYCS